MANDTFERALSLILDLEGGFVDHPRDPGGATNLGITRATLARWRRRPVSAAEVRALGRTEAAAIYRRYFWKEVSADEMPAGLDLALFDHAVNSGPAQAARCLQTVLGVQIDGRIGPKTIAAAGTCRVDETIRAMTRERLRSLRGLSTWPVFGRGWTSRTTRVEAAALRMAREAGPAEAGAASAPAFFTAATSEGTMLETKTLLSSRTVWANLIGLVSVGLGLVGVQTGTIDQNGLADALAQIVAGVSFVASTLFRVQATKQIGAGTG